MLSRALLVLITVQWTFPNTSEVDKSPTVKKTLHYPRGPILYLTNSKVTKRVMYMRSTSFPKIMLLTFVASGPIQTCSGQRCGDLYGKDNEASSFKERRWKASLRTCLGLRFWPLELYFDVVNMRGKKRTLAKSVGFITSVNNFGNANTGVFMNSSVTCVRRASENPPNMDTSFISWIPWHLFRRSPHHIIRNINLNVITLFKEQTNWRVHQIIILTVPESLFQIWSLGATSILTLLYRWNWFWLCFQSSPGFSQCSEFGTHWILRGR
jgi:hypothetical protein